jgi:hypothetical protein
MVSRSPAMRAPIGRPQRRKRALIRLPAPDRPRLPNPANSS